MRLWWVIVLFAVLLGACSRQSDFEPAQESGGIAETSSEVAAPVRGRFIHTVLFWLKEGTTELQTEQLLDDCKSLLGSISSVRFLGAGVPAGTPRDVVDNSYDVGLIVHFDDQAGHDLYRDAPAHLEFIERNQAIWERVQVYDTLLE